MTDESRSDTTRLFLLLVGASIVGISAAAWYVFNAAGGVPG